MTIQGGAGHNTVDGGADDDRIVGGAGYDLSQANLGNDYLRGGARPFTGARRPILQIGASGRA